MRWFLLAVTMFLLAGCGSNVDWFPAGSGGSGGAPDGFTFTPNNVTQTVASSGAYSQSNQVTVTGSDTGGWTVSILNDPSGAASQFSINNGVFTSTPAIVKPNQTLQVQHKPSTAIGGQVITTIQVGTLQETFITTTIANQ